jgi:CMP-N-acetylneuraminic acid synthetase
VIVSTDGHAIAAAAESMGVQVVHRPAALASDTATVDSAVRHAVESINAPEPIIVILYANVPVRPDDLIDRAVSTLIETRADSVQSYSDVGKHHPYWMVSLDEAQRVTPHVQNTVYRRQDLPKLLIPNGGVIAVTRPSLFTIIEGQPHAFLGKDRRGIVTLADEVIDVDGALDFAVAEAILSMPVPLAEIRA